MTYDAREKSRYLGQPVEGYRFAQGSNSWFFTSADRAITLPAGVTVDWLASGHGARVAAEARAAYAAKQLATGNRELPVIDAAVLEGILKAVLTAHGAQGSPAQLAALVVDLYQRALNAGER